MCFRGLVALMALIKTGTRHPVQASRRRHDHGLELPNPGDKVADGGVSLTKLCLERGHPRSLRFAVPLRACYVAHFPECGANLPLFSPCHFCRGCPHLWNVDAFFRQLLPFFRGHVGHEPFGVAFPTAALATGWHC